MTFFTKRNCGIQLSCLASFFSRPAPRARQEKMALPSGFLFPYPCRMPLPRNTTPILWFVALLLADAVGAKDQVVEVSGRVTLKSADGPAVTGVDLSGGEGATVTTGEDGRFRGLKLAVPQDSWIEMQARKEGYRVVNDLDLRRPWPSPVGRSFQIVMAAEAEVRDRAVQYWRAQLVRRLKPSQPKGLTADDEDLPGASLLASYGEWLAAIPKEKPSRAWFLALNLLLAGKQSEAVKVLGPTQEPDETQRRRHLRAIVALTMGDEKAARKELEAAVAGTMPDAWAQMILGHLLVDAGEAETAVPLLDALTNRNDIPATMRARAVLGLAHLRMKAGDLAATVRLFAQADAMFEAEVKSGALPFADEARWASLKGNLVVSALQVEKDPAKTRQQLEPLMKRHRALLARLPDVHENAFVEALELAANVRTALKDYAEAVAFIQERVAFHSEHAKAKPAEHLHQKAQAMEQWGDLAMLQKDFAGAVAHYTEAVKIVMTLSQSRVSEGHLPLLCGLLRKQGALLMKSGKAAEAKTALQQGVSLHQELNRVRPDHVPHMIERALSLQDLGNACLALEETFAAAQAYLAAGQLNNRLVAGGVEAHRTRAFVCLKNVSAITQKTGHTKESMAHALEALKHAERIEADHPDQHPALAEVAMLAGVWVFREGAKAEAKLHLERAVRLYRLLATKDLPGYAVRLGLALCAEAQMSDTEQADKRLTEAEELLSRNPKDGQAELLRQTLRLARKERGELNL